MRLSELQAKLWPAITEGSAEGATGVVRDDLRLGPERRLEIYSQMYFWRLVDALREDFPNLAALLDEDAFTKLVEGYVRAYPSEHPSLGRLGRKMALFLSEHRFGDGRPDAADLAALEWARAEVFVELDTAAAPPSVFSPLSPGQFANARCRLVPSMRVLSLRHDAIALWRALENGEPVPEPIAQAQHVLVWRKGWVVYHVAIDADEARALNWTGQGRTLGEVCEAFAEREQPAAAAFGAIQSWLAEGLVASVDLS